MVLITVISLWDRDQTGYKTCYKTFFTKTISMPDLTVSSLLWKCVFYRPELTGKPVPHGNEIKFYVRFAGYSKISVPVWERYLSASVRSYLALSENTMDYILRSYH